MEPRWTRNAQEDVIGQDRLVRSMIRVMARVPAGAIVALHGAPGSGRDEFARRLAWTVGPGRAGSSDVSSGIHPEVLWFDAWSWSKQGHVVAGIVGTLAHAFRQAGPVRERARELGTVLARMRFDGALVDTAGPSLGGRSIDPVSDLALAFRQLVDKLREGRGGRVLMVVDGAERLAPAVRWQLLDGMRTLQAHQPELVMLISIGRESVMEAAAAHHGPLSSHSISRVLDDVFDLTVTVPNLDIRRIGGLLRDAIGAADHVVRRSFGRDALTGLAAAVAHRPLGSPRFLHRLAWRTVLLAEFAAELRAVRELTEAQWAWVIISERWPDFRRFMIRGGRKRWLELARTVQMMNASKGGLVPVPGGSTPSETGAGIAEWLESDLILSDYLRLHAEGFARDGEGIFWLENLLLAAGL